jgi:uncharacterized membrane protein
LAEANAKKDMKTKSRVRYLTHAALTSALYVILTYVAFWLGLDKGAVQIRFSEALCVLACFTPAAIPGMTVGCFLANFLTGCHILDVLFGTLATLLGVLGGYFLRSLAKNRFTAFAVTLPTVLANVIVVPLLLSFVYGAKEAYPFLLLTVGLGEFLSATVLGTMLLFLLKKCVRRS